MNIRNLDHDEGMLLLRYRLLPPDKQQELLRLMDNLNNKESERPTDSPTE